MGRTSHVLDGGPISQGEETIFGVVRPIEKRWETAVVYTKMTESIEMPFGGSIEACVRWGSRSDESNRWVTSRRCGLLSKLFDHLLCEHVLLLSLVSDKDQVGKKGGERI